MPAMTRTAAEVATMLEEGREIAFLDMREIVLFGIGHPLLATHARRASIGSIDRATLAQWRDDTTRTTYVFDLCSPARTASWPAWPPVTWRSWALRTCWCLRAATLPGVEQVSRQPAGRRICCCRVTTCGLPRPNARATSEPMSWRTSTGKRRSWRRLHAAPACRSAMSCGTNGAGAQRDITCSKVP